MANEFITRKGFRSLDDSQVSGSLFVSGTIEATQTAVLEGLENANADTDKFLVASADGTVKFRTGTEVLSDIGAGGAANLSGAPSEITYFNTNSEVTSSRRFYLLNTGSDPLYGSGGDAQAVIIQGQLQVINDPTRNVGGSSPMQILVGSGSTGDINNPQYDSFIALEQESAVAVGLRAHGSAPTAAQIKMRTDINDAYSIGRLTNPYNQANTLRIKPMTFMEGGLTITGSLTVSGSNTFRNIGPAYFTEGNVGIGTTNPSGKLEVQTGYIISSGSGASDLGFVLDRAGLDTYQIRHLDGGLTIFNATDSRKEMTFLGNGSVGIGTSSPSEKLEVDGNIKADELYLLNGGKVVKALPSFSMGAGSITDEYLVVCKQETTGSLENASGIQGRIYFSRGSAGSYNNSHYIDLNIQMSADTGWVNNVDINVFEVVTDQTGTPAFGYIEEIEIDGIKYLALKARTSGGGAVNHLFFEGAISDDGADTNILSRVRASDGNIKVSSPQPTGYPFYPYVTKTNLGRIGIGTTAPTQKLEVEGGAIQVTNTGGAQLILRGDSNNVDDTGQLDGIIDFLHDDGLYGFRLNTENYAGVTAFHLQELRQGSYLSRLYVRNDGNVGIGTTTPSDKLDVHGIIALNSVAFISQSGNTGFIGDIDAIDAIGNLDINTAGASTRLFLDDSGHVGINTDTPNYSLDVALADANDRFYISQGGSPKAYINGSGAGVFYANLSVYGNVLSGGGGVFSYRGGTGTQVIGHRFQHVNGGPFSATSGNQTMVEIQPNVSQSGTAGYTGLKVNVTETNIGSGTNNLLDLQVDGVTKYAVDRDGDVTIGGDLTVEGIVTAQEFHTEFVSASIIYQSGSTQFGNSYDDTHIFTGSFTIDGGTASNTAKLTIAGNDSIIKLGSNLQGGPHGLQFDYEGGKGDGMSMYYRTSPQQIVFEDSTGTGGTAVMAISRSGAVGIGTTSPQALFNVEGTQTIGWGNLGNSLILAGTTTSGIGFDDNEIAKKGTGPLYFGTIDGGSDVIFRAGGAATRMSIDGDTGYVGIGGVTPAYGPLHVASTENTYIHISNNTTGHSAGNGTSILVENGTGDFVINQRETSKIRLYTSGTERAVMDSSGRLGLGTASPNHTLDIYSDTNMPLRIHRPSSSLDTTEPVGIGFSHRGDNNTSTTDTRAGIFSSYNGDLFFSVDAGGRVDDDPIADAALFIEGANGQVGIGTINPQRELEVTGPGNVYIRVKAPTSSDSSAIELVNTSETWTIRNDDTNDNALEFQSDGGSQVAMLRTGNVGIGTTSPARKLTVAGNASVVDNLSVLKEDTNNESTADSYIMLQSKGTLNNAVTSSEWYIQTIAENVFTKTGDSKFKIVKDHHNGAGNVLEALQIDSTGSLKLHNYGQGNFTADSVYRLAVDANGNVIEESLGDGSINGLGASRYIARWADTDSLTTSSLYEDASGNIGIGTITPAQKLQVEGNADINGVLYMDYGSIIDDGRFRFGSSNDFSLGFHSSTSTLRLAAGNTLTSDVRLVVDSSGNIGIGTTNPVYKLDVNGTGLFRDHLRIVDNKKLLMGSGDMFQIGHNATFSQIATYEGDLLIDNNAADEDIRFRTDDGSGGITNYLVLQGSTTNAYFENPGNVGIGTTTPQAKLQVVGGADVVNIEGSGSTANTSIFSIDGNNGRLFEVSDDLSDSLFSVNTIAGLPVLEVFADNRVVAGAYNQNDFVISGSRVGIGTDAPEAKLQVEGGVYVNGNNPSIKTNYTDNYTPLVVHQNGARQWQIDSVNGDFRLYMDSPINEYTFNVTDDGSVGIGTTSPADKLEVQDGNIRIEQVGNTDAKLIFNPYSSALGTTYQWELVGSNTTNNYNFQIRENGTTYVTVDSSVNGNAGFVGIGTVSPSAQLHVNKSTIGEYFRAGSGGTRELRFTSYNTISDHAGHKIDASSGNGEITLATGGTARVTVDRVGNIGIGETTPSEKLHVSGGNVLIEQGSLIISDDLQAGGSGRPRLKFKEDITVSSMDIYYDGDYLSGDSNYIAISSSKAGVGNVLVATFGGNVGVAASSPITRLTVGSNGDNFVYQTFDRTTGGTDARLWQQGIDTSHGFVWGRATNAGVLTPYMRISSAGDVGIGTSSPTEKLEVAGNIKLSTTGDYLDISGLGYLGRNAGGNVENYEMEFHFADANNRPLHFTNYDGVKIFSIEEGVQTAHNNFNVTGNLTVGGIVTAQEFHTEFVSASIIYQSGSTQFGDTLDDTHDFTGKLSILGNGADPDPEDYNNTLTLAVNAGPSGNDVGAGLFFKQKWFASSDELVNVGGIVGVKTNGSGTYGGGLAFYAQPASAADSFEVMRFNSSGNVGIGTASPEKKLHVNGSVLVGDSHQATTGTPFSGSMAQFTLGGTHNTEPNTGSPRAKLLITGYDNDGASPIYPIYVEDENGNIDFYIKNRTSSGGVGPTTFFAGKVGIGMVPATYELEVKGGIVSEDDATSSQLLMRQVDANIAEFQISPSDDSPSNYFRFRPNSQGAEAGVRVYDRYETDYISLRHDGVKGVLETKASSGYQAGNLQFATAGVTAMTIQSGSNNVGIGTTTPSEKLHVVGKGLFDGNRDVLIDSNLGNVTISAPSSGGWSTGMFFKDAGGNAAGGFGTYGTATALEYYFIGDAYNDTTMVIQPNAGNVGIGTDNPTYKLDVAGEIGIDSYIRHNDDTNTYFGFNGADSYKRHIAGGDRFVQTSTLAYFNTDTYINGEFSQGVSTANKVFNYGAEFRSSGASIQIVFGRDANSTGSGAIGADENSIFSAWNVDSGASEKFRIGKAGAIQAYYYGSGNVTGTPAYNLQVDASGNIIETAAAASSTVGGSGVADEVAVWSSTSNVSGSQSFTWDGNLLFIDGVMEAREKSFNIKHPTKEDKRLIYGVLEGPEHGVYCRGKVEGKVIELPEEWTGLVDEDTITVQLTSIGSHQNLYVKDIKDNKIFISNGNLLSSSIKAFYFVQAMRKDVKPLVTERDA